MEFLKDLFGTGGPQVLPGAPAPAPSKGSDIANVLSRILGGASAGMSAAEGQAPPPFLARPGSGPPFPQHETAKGNFPYQSSQRPLGSRDDNMMMLLKRIFGSTAPMGGPVTPAAGTQIPVNNAPKVGGLY